MPPDVVAPLPVSTLGIVIVKLLSSTIDVTINFLSAKSAAPKLELVIAEKVEASPNKTMSPALKPFEFAVIVTVASLLVVLNALVIAVPDGLVKGCIS